MSFLYTLNSYIYLGLFWSSVFSSTNLFSSQCHTLLGSCLVAQMIKNLPAMQTWVQSLGWEESQEEGIATHSSILAWRIPMDRGVWWSTVHGVAKNLLSTAQHSTVYTRRSSSPSSSRPLLPHLCPQAHPLCLSLFLPCKYVHLFHFPRCHVYALTYDIAFVFLCLTYFIYDNL